MFLMGAEMLLQIFCIGLVAGVTSVNPLGSDNLGIWPAPAPAVLPRTSQETRVVARRTQSGPPRRSASLAPTSPATRHNKRQRKVLVKALKKYDIMIGG